MICVHDIRRRASICPYLVGFAWKRQRDVKMVFTFKEQWKFQQSGGGWDGGQRAMKPWRLSAGPNCEAPKQTFQPPSTILSTRMTGSALTRVTFQRQWPGDKHSSLPAAEKKWEPGARVSRVHHFDYIVWIAIRSVYFWVTWWNKLGADFRAGPTWAPFLTELYVLGIYS